MAVNIAGLVVLAVFYVIILVVGVLAARRKGRNGTNSLMESSIVADRNINMLVGVFTMTATTVGGGYINGTAEMIATEGLAWTVAPFGIFIGLTLGGLIYARPMRDRCYMTMLDPFHEQFGDVVVLMVYIASLCGDLFWTASILSALGTSLSVIANINLIVAIVTSAAVTVLYTMIGQMKSVAYTDVVQLCFIAFGLVLSVPFVLTNEKIGSIDVKATNWLGKINSPLIGQWIDLFIAMTFGTIPWQAYFQRVLSMKTARQAQILSVAGGSSALILVIPSVLIGAASRAADWNTTSLGISPMKMDKSNMVLPYVLNEFTPPAVSIVGLGAISAAVMSSMDSAILGSSSMFTYNIYKQLFRKKASQKELLWIQRLAIVCVGGIATVISIYVPVIYGLFILAADIVFVIVLPQLTCALFFKFTNSYGAISGYLVGVICRLGAGEFYLNFDPFIKYPWYHKQYGQIFPFRTFSMCSSFATILVISVFTNAIFARGILSHKLDFLNCLKRRQSSYIETSTQEVSPDCNLSCDKVERSHDQENVSHDTIERPNDQEHTSHDTVNRSHDQEVTSHDISNVTKL